jgi:uracil-DNA glycosylase
LLNTVLTVRDGEPQSHSKQGWEWFTDQVIQQLVADHEPILFLLWGGPAQKKQSLIHAPHGCLSAVHPSPLSAHRGFFGSRPFSQCNAWLQARGYPSIDWRLP